MLNRRFRLHKSRDVRKTLQKGQRMSEKSVRLSYVMTNRTVPRLTVIVSTKVAKRATERNRLRRKIRGLCQQFVIAHPRSGVDAVITATRGDDAISLTSDCQALLQKLGSIIARPKSPTNA